jgi:hypothetical protein
MHEAGVPCVPGSPGLVLTEDEALKVRLPTHTCAPGPCIASLPLFVINRACVDVLECLPGIRCYRRRRFPVRYRMGEILVNHYNYVALGTTGTSGFFGRSDLAQNAMHAVFKLEHRAVLMQNSHAHLFNYPH